MLIDALLLGWPLLVGLPVVLLLRTSGSGSERAGASFLLGSAVSGLALTLLGALGFTYSDRNLEILLAAWLLVSIAVVVRFRRRLEIRRPQPTSGLGPVAWIFILLTLFNLLTTADRAWLLPIGVTDVVVFWFPKATLLAHTHQLLTLRATVYPDYPPLWPIVLSLLTQFRQGDPAVKLLPTVYLAATLAYLFGFLRRRCGSVAAAVAVWVISGIPYLWFDYGVYDLLAEVPSMAFITVSILMLGDYADNDRPGDAIGAAVLAAATSLTRPEGFEHALALAAVLLLLAFRRGQRWFGITLVAIAGSGYVLWHAVVRLGMGGASSTYPFDSGRVGLLVGSFLKVLRYAAHQLGDPTLFGPVVISGVAIVVLGWRQRTLWPMLAVFVLDLAFTIATYTFLPSTRGALPPEWWLRTGFKRQFLHLAPILPVVAALVVGPAVAALAAEREMLGRAIRRRTRLAVRRGRVTRAVFEDVGALLLLGLASTYLVLVTGGDMVLADLIPYGVKGAQSIGYDGGYRSISLVIAPGETAAITYDLLNQSDHIRLDSVFRRYSSVDASVVVREGGPVTAGFQDLSGTREVSYSARQVTASTDATRLAVPVSISADKLALLVHADTHAGTTYVDVVDPTLRRTDLTAPVVALLLLAALAMVVRACLRAGVVNFDDPRLEALLVRSCLGLTAVLLVAAAIIQQLDVLAGRALPLWL